jgi:KDO2-lipid IV(A) lauroyltransferase
MMYGLSNFLAFILRRVIKYRKKVIRKNLNNSFPDYTVKQINDIERKFYRHLADIFLEGIKNLSMRKSEVMRRYRCKNPEILAHYSDRSVILVSSHYNSWEWMVLSLELQFSHHGIGVGAPIRNQYLDKKINAGRTKFGTEVVFASNVRDTFETYLHENRPCTYMMLFDQFHNPKKSYWTTFLNQDTGFIYGPEYFAKKYDLPVFYYSVQKVKRGYYEFELFPITDQPNACEYGEIIEKCVRHLEKDIIVHPEFWLWSHNRWKNSGACVAEIRKQ